MTSEIGRFLGGMIGEVKEVDDGGSGDCVGKYIRVRVVIDVTQPLRHILRVDVLNDDKESTIQLRYEKLPDHCNRCGQLGHIVRDCSLKVTSEGPEDFNTLYEKDSTPFNTGLSKQKVAVDLFGGHSNLGKSNQSFTEDSQCMKAGVEGSKAQISEPIILETKDGSSEIKSLGLNISTSGPEGVANMILNVAAMEVECGDVEGRNEDGHSANPFYRTGMFVGGGWGSMEIRKHPKDIMGGPFYVVFIAFRVCRGCSESCVRHALFEAPGPDYFLAVFYQNFWSTVGGSVTNACIGVLNDGLELAEVHNTFITLIPKVKKAERMTDFHPIS
ncbi:hypothetical protein Dsin_004901 [Dipteronia sinensis]|uniref:CCHC-type domain-containing protein n=1 Tax=Dipteronia sinensis TaxID=43782 RepID=A0AAE0EEE2_9ROSI|nr:hypothetical protein Dsin_004901 [Dipteronia sinensis]